MTGSEIKPLFENPQALRNGINAEKDFQTPSNTEILDELINEFEKVDFQGQAFPQVEKLRAKKTQLELDPEKNEEELKKVNKELRSLKVTQNKIIVIVVSIVLQTAAKNNWGLCKEHDFIYIYNGQWWVALEKEQVQRFLGEAAEKMGVEKLLARLYKFRDELFSQFLSSAYFPRPPKSSDFELINLQNGTYEFSKNGSKLRPFNQYDFIKYQLPFGYDPNAQAPIFRKYLERCVPDIQRQMVLAEFLAYSLLPYGTLKAEKALILFGSGANGKSVFFDIVSALIGWENISNFSLASLTNDNGYFRALLANKIINYGSEINGKLQSSFFKQLVSGEPVEARLPHGKPFTLRDYAKLIFNCNELPKDVEQTNAYFRRFLIIPFDVTIPEHEQDKKLAEKIIESELPGVFNWVLEGLERLMAQQGFTPCDAADRALQRYRVESDSVQLFLEESCFDKSPLHSTPLKDMYHKYKLFTQENGYRPVSNKTFSSRLKGLGFEIKRTSAGRQVYAVSTLDHPF